MAYPSGLLIILFFFLKKIARFLEYLFLHVVESSWVSQGNWEQRETSGLPPNYIRLSTDHKLKKKLCWGAGYQEQSDVHGPSPLRSLPWFHCMTPSRYGSLSNGGCGWWLLVLSLGPCTCCLSTIDFFFLTIFQKSRITL